MGDEISLERPRLGCGDESEAEALGGREDEEQGKAQESGAELKTGAFLGAELEPAPGDGEQAELDIYSYGQDGAPGGEGEDADVGNWK